MKKKTLIISLMAIILCFTILTGVVAPRKKPILANEMAKAEEFIEYSTDEEQANEDDCETCIFIVGKSKLTLTPDQATITACIEKFNQELTESKNECLSILDTITVALEEQGIEKEKISLNYFTAHPSYDYSTSLQPLGYYSKASFSFEVEKIDSIPTYIDVLTENGVTSIYDICYSLSNIEEQYNTALSQAVEHAKTKASKLFDSQDIQICGIREESVYSASTLCREYNEVLSNSLIGKIEVEARVNVMFKKA